ENYLREQLSQLDQVVNVRGRGFLLGIELREKAATIHRRLLERKIISGTSSDPHVLRLLPPLCLKQAEVKLFVDELSEILNATDSVSAAI
ncbi:MAG TPA: aminotransferase class III-fold pyridoxal phosphate-dependent enzyme, partial [Pyrinomonadaceae bacterium]|nr:aminotransferase class III-fold pyridoxal phosphate-dependent enzyme [Pyrinomonadaceae bacterium]